MIYGIFIGIVLIACGIVSAWISWYATTALGLTAIFVILLFWTISERKLLQTKAVPTAPAPGAIPTTTQPAITPQPATPKTARSFSWSFAVIAILVVALGWMIYSTPGRQTSQTYVPPPPPTQLSGAAAPAAFAPPALVLAPAPEPQRKDVSGLPTFLVCEGHQNGPCFGKLRREEGTFYDEGGDIIFSATNYTAVPGFQVGNQIRGEGQKKGGEIIPFRAIRRNG